ncbi:Rne/Rng family ribonuclease [Kitasatospora sp. NBC_01287]|uniref:Rne/Rng family ribonuclease n=1 Tax=Kitasatospora sp. NBC_01287 TaxID=2903573 RepID=UPI0022574A20|nr:Rne/Rng family ribonuclease [Kitasatospora sp. NBC_01287]MCX4749010.1 Rne/Rng family ribonuclease [Kitasatospora sp. NBC_01287]
MPENENNEQNDSQQTPIGDAAPPRRRRRAVSRPAGTPQGAEGGETVIPVESAPTVTEPAAESAAAEPAAAEPPVRARRTRKRAESPVTSPAAEAPVTEEPAAEVAPVEEPAAEKPVRARRTRKRAEAAPVEAEAPAEAPAEQPAAEVAPVEEPAAEKPVRARRTRKRAESPVTSPAAEAPVTEEPAAEEPAAEEEPVEAAPAVVAPPAPAEEHHTEAPRARRRAVRPATAVFQAPVFQEPASYVAPAPAAAPAAAAPAAAPAVSKATAAPAPAAAKAAAPAAAPVEEDEEYEYSGVGRRRRGGRAPVRVTPPTGRKGAAARSAAQAAPVAKAAPAVQAAPPVQAAPAEPAAAAVAPAQQGPEQDGDWEEDGRPSSRRRRRGGRRRRRGEAEEFEAEGQEQSAAEPVEPADEADTEPVDEDDEDDLANGLASSRRRRRRRRRSGDSGGEAAEPVSEDGVRTVVKVREPRRRSTEPSFDPDEVQSIKGSTRLEAKKQRRREGRELGRRRVPIITEAEFLARRESVERVMVVRQNGERTQIGVLEDGVLVEHYVNKEQATSYVGNVYLGKVQNVLPSMEAAFVDIGKGRNAVLYAGEVNFGQLGHSGPRRIESVLKSGQSVLVQVSKDPIGHKGARLTSQISLPGRYLVYVPEGSMTGISRKLPENERARLKQILKKIVPDDAGVIVRTAAEGASEDELTRDVQRLQAQWEEIQKKAASGNAPTLLYGEPDMTVRVVRDIFNEDFSKVIVSGGEAWNTIHEYVGGVAPDLVDRLQKWTSNVDVFATYRIDEQLMKALDRKVWLPSGGSLVIDRTEAMVVVDVNTGKFVGQGGNLEETVTRNNIEAAEEIVRQLRLRDLGGIIVIDFIDMVLESNRDLVLRRLLECLGRDRTKHQVAEVTSLGLVQMTRKRVGQGLLESFSESCVHCNGRGVIVHMEQPTSPGGGGGPVGTAGEGAGAGKRRRRGKGGAGHEEPQPHLIEDEAAAEHEHEEFELVDRGAQDVEAVEAVESAEDLAQDVEEAAVEQAATEAPAPVVEQPSLVEIPVAAPAAGRTRRRAVRKATASAGSPDEAEIVVLQSRAEAVVEAALAAAAPVAAERPAEVAEATVGVAEVAEVAEQATEAAEATVAAEPAEEAEEPAPKKRAPRKAAAKKTATATTAAAKKTTTAAKKTTARKTATKRTSAAAKKAAAAEGDSAAE